MKPSPMDATAANVKLHDACEFTKLCKFHLAGTCNKTDCKFAHSVEDIKAMPDLQRTKICPAMAATGSCGDRRCAYAHSKSELRKLNLLRTVNAINRKHCAKKGSIPVVAADKGAGRTTALVPAGGGRGRGPGGEQVCKGPSRAKDSPEVCAGTRPGPARAALPPNPVAHVPMLQSTILIMAPALVPPVATWPHSPVVGRPELRTEGRPGPDAAPQAQEAKQGARPKCSPQMPRKAHARQHLPSGKSTKLAECHHGRRDITLQKTLDLYCALFAQGAGEEPADEKRCHGSAQGSTADGAQPHPSTCTMRCSPTKDGVTPPPSPCTTRCSSTVDGVQPHSPPMDPWLLLGDDRRRASEPWVLREDTGAAGRRSRGVSPGHPPAAAEPGVGGAPDATASSPRPDPAEVPPCQGRLFVENTFITFKEPVHSSRVRSKSWHFLPARSVMRDTWNKQASEYWDSTSSPGGGLAAQREQSGRSSSPPTVPVAEGAGEPGPQLAEACRAPPSGPHGSSQPRASPGQSRATVSLDRSAMDAMPKKQSRGVSSPSLVLPKLGCAPPSH